MNGRVPQKITRRSLFTTSGKLALGAAGILTGSSGLFYYGAIQQAKRREQSSSAARELPGNIVKLGEFDRLNAIEGVEKVGYEATIRDGWVSKSNKGFVYVTKGATGELLIISPVCTHLGCNVELASEAQRGTRIDLMFRCPCHGAEFALSGKSVGGFIGLQALDTYKPVIAGGSVYFDILSPLKLI